MPRFKLLLVFPVIIALSSCGGSNGSNRNDTAYSSAKAYVESEGFIGTILVKKNNSYLLREAYGYADQSTLQPNDIDTRYRIGSLTKAFTALAIVQLKNENVIVSYDGPIANYLPAYPDKDEITIRHVLNHRSGIPEYLASVDPRQSYTPSEQVDLFKNLDLYFGPGQAFNYSNSNYVLLGYLIEVLTGTDYASYLDVNILSVLGMVNTEYGESIIEGAHYAKGYADFSQQQSASYLDMSIPYSAGALSSNINDLEIWAESFLNSSLLSEQDIRDIFSEGEYGFGWIIKQLDGKLVYTHSGGISGFSSIIAIFPQEEAFIVALSNVEGEHEKLNRIVSTIAKNEL